MIACVAMMSWQSATAQDMVHDVSGIVKHIDHGTKTIVVKASDGTEHTIKYTGKTSWEGTKGAGKGIKDGSEVSVKYTEKGGEKTATAVKDATKDTGKALSQ
jgi:Cu/Ag efflux protein CusF